MRGAERDEERERVNEGEAMRERGDERKEVR